MGPHAQDDELELLLLLEAIYSKYHHDFRHYAAASLRRRLASALEQLGLGTLSALRERVLRDPATFERVLGALTVQVSDMFRDPPFFGALRERVLPVLRTYPSLKLWVAGCASGEEVYALAILLREEGLLDRSTIYASDISPQALRRAESGIYALDRVAGFSRNYAAAGGRGSLSDYYTTAYDAAAFDRSLRRNVVFTDHSLATDQVFAEVQLITCRNVLIYFDRELQDRALGLFRDALCERGFLGLGTGETVRFSAEAEAFEPLAQEVRIYRKR